MSAKVTHSIAKRLVKMGCEVVVLTSDIDLNGRRGLLPRQEEIDGVLVKRIDATRITSSSIPYVFYNPLSMAKGAGAISKALNDADIIHSQTIHGLLNIGINLMLIAKRHNSRLVVGSHGIPSYNSFGTWMGFGLWTVLMKYIASQSSLVITVAKSSIPGLIRLGIRPERIRHIPNGVDCSAFTQSSEIRRKFRQDLGLKEDELLVLSLGQLRAAKGISVFLDSIPEILSTSPRVRVLIAGAGPMAPMVSQWAGQLPSQLKGKVSLASRNITEQELPLFFNACDIFVLPSYWEGFPLSLLEAMACGACPVASRVGDIPFILNHGTGGYLIEPGNPKALASAVDRLSRDDALRRGMSDASKQAARAFDWDQIAKRYYEAYENLVN